MKDSNLKMTYDQLKRNSFLALPFVNQWYFKKLLIRSVVFGKTFEGHVSITTTPDTTGVLRVKWPTNNHYILQPSARTSQCSPGLYSRRRAQQWDIEKDRGSTFSQDHGPGQAWLRS